jgi:hypothetical protein
MGKPITLEKVQVEASLGKIKKAREQQTTRGARRTSAFEAMIRKPWPKDDLERSRFQASDVLNQIETVLPTLEARVLASDQKVRIVGPDDKVARALTIKCRQTIRDQGGFLLYLNAILDGLISINGTIKIHWTKDYRRVVEEHPEVPEEKLLYLRQLLAAGKIQGLQVEENAQPEAEIDTGVDVMVAVQAPRTFRVRVTLLELERSGPKLQGIRPEEFLTEVGKADINDRRGCGHEVTMIVGELLDMQRQYSLPGKPFFDPEALREACEKATGGDTNDGGALDENAVRQAFHWNGADGTHGSADLTADELHKSIKVVEWSDQVIAGGKLVFALIWFGGDVKLRAEENSDGIVPMVTWTPIPLPHSIHGMSVAENFVHEQHSRSAMGRALIDYLGRSVDEETYLLNRGTDILGLKRRVAGQIVNAVPGKDFVRQAPSQIDAKLFQGMALLKTEGEERGPGNRWLQGGDVDPRNTTATGQKIMSRASLGKVGMIGACFSELLQADLYQKIVFLYQRCLGEDEVVSVVVDGEPVGLTKKTIQGDYRAQSEIGLEYDYDDRRVEKAMQIKGDMMAMIQMFPMMFPLKKVAAAQKSYYAAMGEPNPGDFYVLPPGWEDWTLGSAPPGTPPQLPPGAPAGLLGPGGPGGEPGFVPPELLAAAAAGQGGGDIGPDQAIGGESSQPDRTMMGG